MGKVWYRKNREKAIAYTRAWRKRNPNKAAEYWIESKRKNPEKKRQYSKSWRAKNREKARESSRRARRKNPEKARAAVRRWAKNNPEKVREKSRRERATRRGNGGAYTSTQWTALCNKHNNKCLCCNKRRRLTADHVVPVSKGGTSYITNIQPLCMPCNLSKGTKIIDYRRKHAS